MDGLENYVSSNSLALIVSGIIFVITVALVLRNLISFVITCVLLFFAVVSGVAIGNNDIVRDYFKSDQTEVTTKTDNKGVPEESRIDAIRDRLMTIYQQLVETLSNHSKESQGDSGKSQKLRSSVENVLQELDAHREKLQDFLEDHQSAIPAK